MTNEEEILHAISDLRKDMNVCFDSLDKQVVSLTTANKEGLSEVVEKLKSINKG